MKKTFLLTLSVCVLLLGACGTQNAAAPADDAAPAASSAEVSIVLGGDGAEIRGGGARAEGSVVTVAAVGTYRLSGSLTEGQIVVDTGEDAMDVTLILDGVSVSNASGPALWIRQAKNVHLQLAEGSENLLVSGSEADLASFDETRSGAALFAEDDLILEGEGSLRILGYLNNGITCKDDLKIRGGSLDVLSANNGVRASESLTISGGSVSVRSGNDGLKTSSDKKADKGMIEISGGSITLSCAGDAIDAVTELHISGGEIRTETRQDLVVTGSCKGLKAASLVEISGGELALRADEDAIHCDGEVRMSGGEVRITAKTGIQAGLKGSGEGDILLSGGTLFVSAVKQGLKAEGAIFANNELLVLCSSDKQAEPHEGGQSWIYAAVSGSAGDEVRVGVGMEGYTAPLSFKHLLISSAELRKGEQVSVSVAGRSYSLTAR